VVGASVVIVATVALAFSVWYAQTRPQVLLARAEAATRAGDWPKALATWRQVNASPRARGSTHLAEARAALALGRAGEAEQALVRALEADPTNPEPWRLRLELLRVEDDPLRAQEIGWAAYASVPPSDRRAVLRELTLALLADLPDDHARRTLALWAGAGAGTDASGSSPNASAPSNLDARVAFLQRVAAMPRSGDPARAEHAAELMEMLKARPDNVVVREALVTALADIGEQDQGRDVLDSWPESRRDARYWRLRGRWDLEYDHKFGPAAEAFRRALVDLPHDWKTHVRLARALQNLGRDAEARAEAETVARLRELLDPAVLGPRLAADLDQARDLEHDPRAAADLADLCSRAGLTRLAQAWRREAAAHPAQPPFKSTL
jgi:tetratricopeptide (TPR) repeat protein